MNENVKIIIVLIVVSIVVFAVGYYMEYTEKKSYVLTPFKENDPQVQINQFIDFDNLSFGLKNATFKATSDNSSLSDLRGNVMNE